MAQFCEVTKRRPMAGNNVSHANNKTRRRFQLNIRIKRFFSPELNRWVKLKVSTKGQRIINKLGIDAVLANLAQDKK
jgi:large subunit ribosomal protein L28